VIDVAYTRADLRPADLSVVVDVLRATSTATQALAAGYRRVLFADSIDRALELRAPDRVLAGERECVIPPGFDFGNSPIEAARCHAEEFILATTNGAPTIVAAKQFAPTVLLGCLLNLDAVRGALCDPGDWEACDLQIVCSGTDGAPALEDVYAAGRLCKDLQGSLTDAALMAIAVADAYPDAIDALGASADARVLRTVGATDDIAYCARESVLGTLPRVADADAGVATVVDTGDTVAATGDAAAPPVSIPEGEPTA